MLQRMVGCFYAGPVQSLEDRDDGISITRWSRRDDALTFERSGKAIAGSGGMRSGYCGETCVRVRRSAPESRMCPHVRAKARQP